MGYVRQTGQWCVQAFFGNTVGWKRIDENTYSEWEDAVYGMKEIAPSGCLGEYRIWDVSQESV